MRLCKDFSPLYVCTYLYICLYLHVYVRKSIVLVYINVYACDCYVLTFDPAQNAIQGDAPEGIDTFQWQLGEEIAWAEIGKQNGTS